MRKKAVRTKITKLFKLYERGVVVPANYDPKERMKQWTVPWITIWESGDKDKKEQYFLVLHNFPPEIFHRYFINCESNGYYFPSFNSAIRRARYWVTKATNISKEE